MKCDSCGSENPPNARFCAMCGEVYPRDRGGSPAVMQSERTQYKYAREPETWSEMSGGRTEKLLCRLFGGLAWLMVSIGTFLVAFGYLGLVDYGDEQRSFDMIGYGMVVYAIAAMFVSIARFVRVPR